MKIDFKKSILIFLMLLLIVMPLSFADSETVEVKIPQFVVKINGIQFDSTKEIYPFIQYKGITYLPMTWDMSKTLGLSLKWDLEDGLRITKDQAMTLSLPKGGGHNVFKKSYRAKVIEDVVKVNGVLIDNTKETYPLLNYKNITYFPMTYHFMVNAFGCVYKWDDQEGLSISADVNLKVNLPEPTIYEETFTKKEMTCGYEVIKGLIDLDYNENNPTIGFSTSHTEFNMGYVYAFDYKMLDQSGNEIIQYTFSLGTPLEGQYSGIGVGLINGIEYETIKATLKLYPKALFDYMNQQVLKEIDFEVVKPSQVSVEKLKGDGGVYFATQTGHPSDAVNGEIRAYHYYHFLQSTTLLGETVYAIHNGSYPNQAPEIVKNDTTVYLLDKIDTFRWAGRYYEAIKDSYTSQYYGEVIRLYDADLQLIKIYVLNK